MVKPKPKTKRVPLKLKYNIKKKAKEKRRKLSKLARQNPTLSKGPKKDPGIPNLWPFKAALLDREEKRKEKLTEEQQRQREARKKVLEQKRKRNAQDAASGDLSSHPSSSSRAAAEYSANNHKSVQRSKWYMRELRKVIDDADVIIEVLDARDPLGCRCPSVEKMIQGKVSEKSNRPKKLILLLNKIDLVPPEAVQQWLTHLRREFPAIAFRSSTQKQSSHLSSSDSVGVKESLDVVQSRNTAVGAPALLQLLKQYSLSLNLKTAISVAVIGYPNVGKSSVINSLKRSKAAGVSAQAGFTKTIQRIKLDKNIELFDSPGVLFDANQSESELVLRNALKVEQLEDPVEAVEAIVNKCDKAALLELYCVADFNTAEEFVYLVAQKRGKLLKGGVPDRKAAAIAILNDWSEGNIPYYTMPPATASDPFANSAKIVDDWGAELNVDTLLDESNKAALSSLSAPNRKFMQMAPSQPLDVDMDEKEEDGASSMHAMDEDEEDDEDEDEDGKEDAAGQMERSDAKSSVSGPARSSASTMMETLASNPFVEMQPVGAASSKKGSGASTAKVKKLLRSDDENTPQLNKLLKQKLKNAKKGERKQAKREQDRALSQNGDMDVDSAGVEAASSSMSVKPFDPNAPYDFEADYVG